MKSDIVIGNDVLTHNNQPINSIAENKITTIEEKHDAQVIVLTNSPQTKQPRYSAIDPVSPASKLKNNKVSVVKGNTIPLQQQSAKQLWQYWQNLLQRSELQQIPIINTLLAERLRVQTNPEIYQGINELLNNQNLPNENKALLIDLLSEIATPEALNQLLELAMNNSESELYLFFLQAIAHIGDNRWDGKYHEELSPPLEAAWSNPNVTDEPFLYAIGTAITKIGAPSGIGQLLESVSVNNSGKTTEKPNRIKQQVVFVTIPVKVSNPNAVKPLADCLNQDAFGTSTFDVCGHALATINTPAATQHIVTYSQTASKEETVILKNVITKIDDEESKQLLVNATSLEFQSPENKAVLDAAAASISSSSSVTSSSDVFVPLSDKK